MPATRLGTYRASFAEAVVVDRLFDWLSIPSISADPEHDLDVEASAEWLLRAASDAGFQRTELLTTA